MFRAPGKRVAINLSGGTDSALGLWMLAHQDVTIIPLTIIDDLRPTNIFNAYEIRAWVMSRFDVEIEPIRTHEFVEVVKTTASKGAEHNKFTLKLRKEGVFDTLIHCRTANPIGVPELLDNREVVRDKPVEVLRDTHGNTKLYQPYVGVAKDWVAQVYKDNDLMDLFNLTASCIGYHYDTDVFTKACKKCWWCREKLWAFGCYDYGEI